MRCAADKTAAVYGPGTPTGGTWLLPELGKSAVCSLRRHVLELAAAATGKGPRDLWGLRLQPEATEFQQFQKMRLTSSRRGEFLSSTLPVRYETHEILQMLNRSKLVSLQALP